MIVGYEMELKAKEIQETLKKNNAYDPIRSEEGFNALREKLERRKRMAAAAAKLATRIRLWIQDLKRGSPAQV